MPRWLFRVLAEIRSLAGQGRVRFTYKALREIAELEPALDEDEVCDVLAGLDRHDCAGRRASEITGEWMYIFKPRLDTTAVYLKLILRTECVVISFHEDETDETTPTG